MKTLKSIWDKINGYKTAILMALVFAWQGVHLVLPKVVSQDIYEWVLSILVALGGGSVGHKIIKIKQETKSINN
jgi:hypothetical protein